MHPQSRGDLLSKVLSCYYVNAILPGKPERQQLVCQGWKTTGALNINGSFRTLKKMTGNSVGEGDKGVNNFTQVLYITVMNADCLIIKGAIQRVWGSL